MEAKERFYRLYSDGTITVVHTGVRARKPVNRKKTEIDHSQPYEVLNEIKEDNTDYKALGKKTKTFAMTPAVARVIRSSAIKQYLTKKYKIHFVTLTFPQPEKVDSKAANKCLSKFLDNLKKNYKLNSYVITKESTNKLGNYFIHFHCLLDMPFTDYRIINRAWNHTYNSIFPFSKNALTTGKFPIVKDVVSVAKYISKYISKAYSVIFESRFYFCSRNVLDRGTLIDFNTFVYLTTKYETQLKITDWYIIYRLKSFSGLAKWFLLPEKPKKFPKKQKIIPDSKPIFIDF